MAGLAAVGFDRAPQADGQDWRCEYMSESRKRPAGELARTRESAPDRVAEREISNEAKVIRGVFRVAGLAAGSAVRGSQWAAGNAIGVGRELAQAAVESRSSAELADRAAEQLRSLARSTLGVEEGAVRQVISYVPPATGRGPSKTPAELRSRGDALLAASADVYSVDDVHPAYDRILGELAPDEARMLRFLAINGSQPCVDVRTSRPLGIGAELIAADLSTVPQESGVRHEGRARSYLINLKRLGLVTITHEPVILNRYMVLEVQPIVEEAKKKAGRGAKIVRKGMRLTEFGADFCETCFTLDGRAALQIRR